MPLKSKNLVLVIACPDVTGIVAAVSGFLAERKAFITESSHFGDPDTGQFFMRTVFKPHATSSKLHLEKDFAKIAKRFSMDWALHDAEQKARVLILVSKLDHCLNDLLYRYRAGILPIEIPAIVSNHSELKHLAEWHQIPFHHLPVTDKTKAKQEARILELVKKLDIDLVVLARYMQVLSPKMCDALEAKAINIHHSFLPGFKGAKPYLQAHARGVKLIGATAHYVTRELDEGPIIEQEVERVDHSHTASDLAAIGRDVENVVLARAVSYHITHRVLLNGRKTVVFR